MFESIKNDQASVEKGNRYSFGLGMDWQKTNSVHTEDQFSIRIQDALTQLFSNGYRYNMYLIASVNGDPYLWKQLSQILPEMKHSLLFNTTQFADQVEDSYIIKQMLKNIANSNGTETMAVCTGKGEISKLRPIIYDMTMQEEIDSVNAIVDGGTI